MICPSLLCLIRGIIQLETRVLELVDAGVAFQAVRTCGSVGVKDFFACCVIGHTCATATKKTEILLK